MRSSFSLNIITRRSTKDRKFIIFDKVNIFDLPKNT